MNSTIIKYELPLLNVTSEHCALIIDNALANNEQLLTHKVDVNNSKVTVEFNEGTTSLSEIITSINNLGYKVITSKINLPVLQLSCASCAITAQKTLEKQPGVINASVNFANTTAQIEYIPSKTLLQKLKKSIQAIGYDLIISDTEIENDSIDTIKLNNYEKLKTTTLWAILLTIPIVIIAMFFMNLPYANYIEWLLATPVVFYFGKDFFINAWKQLKHGSANMDTLVALSTGIAYLFSLVITLFPAITHSIGIHGHVYFESSAVVITFILIGKLLEEKAKSTTSSAIKKLIGLQPKSVTRIDTNGNQTEIAISKVQFGDILVAKPGEKIAVDGNVIEGNSFVDESMMTGEPIAIEKKLNDKVYAGTINQKGSFNYKAEKIGDDTFLAQIIKMVQEAQGSKAPVQKMVDKIASIFVPIILVIALISLITWILVGGENGLSHGLLAFITVLIIACPCALGLATPTALMVGIGKGAEAGILIKDAESLETTRTINAIILDKTGTITEGKPKVVGSLWFNNDDRNKAILSTIERQSEHPLAEAIVNFIIHKETLQLQKFESITGYGVKAYIDGQYYFVGNKKLIEMNAITLSNVQLERIDTWLELNNTLVYFSNDKEVIAIFAINDVIKATSIQAIQTLQKMDIEVYMLTGDNEAAAKNISKQAGINQYKAGVLPSEKADFIKTLQSQGKIVAMVGDGINDSNALAQADVSIAMGKGSDIAIDVAKMTLISSDLTKIVQAIHLSKFTVTTIKQNLFWAFFYNVVSIPIAAGILFPINGYLLDPMVAGAAMALSSVSVVGNSLLLKRKAI